MWIASGSRIGKIRAARLQRYHFSAFPFLLSRFLLNSQPTCKDTGINLDFQFQWSLLCCFAKAFFNNSLNYNSFLAVPKAQVLTAERLYEYIAIADLHVWVKLKR